MRRRKMKKYSGSASGRIDLAPLDAALIFKSYGELRVMVPNVPDDAEPPPAYRNALRAAVLFDCPAALALVDEYMARKLEERCQQN
jgi:hypothetical protein